MRLSSLVAVAGEAAGGLFPCLSGRLGLWFRLRGKFGLGLGLELRLVRLSRRDVPSIYFFTVTVVFVKEDAQVVDSVA